MVFASIAHAGLHFRPARQAPTTGLEKAQAAILGVAYRAASGPSLLSPLIGGSGGPT